MKCSRWRADSAPTCIMGNSHFSLAHLHPLPVSSPSPTGVMDLSELELDYIAHIAGQKVETHQQPPVADPIDQTVNLWKGADAQILSHVSLRSALPSMTAPSSPVRKSTLGLNIATPDPSESVVMDSVGSPVIGLPLPELPAKWSLPPSVSFVEWQPKSIVLD